MRPELRKRLDNRVRIDKPGSAETLERYLTNIALVCTQSNKPPLEAIMEHRSGATSPLDVEFFETAYTVMSELLERGEIKLPEYKPVVTITDQEYERVWREIERTMFKPHYPWVIGGKK